MENVQGSLNEKYNYIQNILMETYFCNKAAKLNKRKSYHLYNQKCKNIIFCVREIEKYNIREIEYKIEDCSDYRLKIIHFYFTRNLEHRNSISFHIPKEICETILKKEERKIQ